MKIPGLGLNDIGGAGGGINPLAWIIDQANKPDIALDFANNRAWTKSSGLTAPAASLLTTVNASGGYVNDSLGNWKLTGANLPRISNLGLLVEESRTNSIRNNSMQGAVAGADNVELLSNGNFAAAGTGWTTHTAGGGSASIATGAATLVGDGATFGNYISQQITGLTPGRNYVFTYGAGSGLVGLIVGTFAGAGDIVAGTNTFPNGGNATFPDRIGFIAPAGGSVWVSVGRFTATTVTVTSLSVQDGERVENGGFTSNPVNAAQSTVQNGWQWTNSAGTGTVVYNSGPKTVTLTGDGTLPVGFFSSFPTVSGVTYTVTVNISSGSLGGLNFGTSAGGSQNGTVSGQSGVKSLQFTASASTSWVSFFQTSATPTTVSSVSVQSAGVLPTNWATDAVAAGVTQAIVATGTQNGIDYFDIKYTGTPSVGGTWRVFDESAVTQIAAATGQAWAHSIFMGVVAGAATNIQAQLQVQELTAGGVNVLINTNPTDMAPLLGAVPARFNYIPTLSGGVTTAFIRSDVLFTVTTAQIGGGAAGVTVRIGWPQLELGASVTSPIRTTAAAATRAADVVSLTSPPAFGAAYSMYAAGTPQTPNPYTGAQNLIQLDAGADAQRLVDRRNIASTLTTSLVGGTGGAFPPAGTWVQNTQGKLASAVAAGDQASVFNGGTPGTNTAAVLPTTPTAFRIGSNAGGTESWNGFLSYAAIWASQRVPNAELQAMTT